MWHNNNNHNNNLLLLHLNYIQGIGFGLKLLSLTHSQVILHHSAALCPCAIKNCKTSEVNNWKWLLFVPALSPSVILHLLQTQHCSPSPLHFLTHLYDWRALLSLGPQVVSTPWGLVMLYRHSCLCSLPHFPQRSVFLSFIFALFFFFSLSLSSSLHLPSPSLSFRFYLFLSITSISLYLFLHIFVSSVFFFIVWKWENVSVQKADSLSDRK